jgi:serine phosphatase RsbU (regulator of sigma subunit)
MLKAWRILRKNSTDLVELLAQLNDEIRPEVLPSQFVTVCAGIIDPDSGEVELVLAGHHPAVVFNPDGPVLCRHVGTPGTVVGMLSRQIFAAGLTIHRFTLAEGEHLVMYSDGCIEARKQGGDEEFGLFRLCGCLGQAILDQSDLQPALDTACAEVTDWAGLLDDDLTVLAFHRTAVEEIALDPMSADFHGSVD